MDINRLVSDDGSYLTLTGEDSSPGVGDAIAANLLPIENAQAEWEACRKAREVIEVGGWCYIAKVIRWRTGARVRVWRRVS